MEGYVSEVRIFSGDFAPKFWALCQGQTINISQNQALFALLGTYYGGDGQNNFKLPDLRGNTVIGVGQGPGLSNYNLGSRVGVSNVSLTQTQLPLHNHLATVTPNVNGGNATATLYALPDGGTQTNANGAYISKDSSGQLTHFAAPATGTPVPMAPQSITVSNLNIPAPTVNILFSGGNLPHNNMMPSIALNYIICLQGIFPSRN